MIGLHVECSFRRYQMAVPVPGVLASESYLEELALRAESIYENKLKAILEPMHNNEFVAIHVDTGDYAVATNFRDASRTLMDRHGVDGKLDVMKIGPEPEQEDRKSVV